MFESSLSCSDAFVNVIPCCSGVSLLVSAGYGNICMCPMQQNSVRCSSLSPGSGRDARLPCITALDAFLNNSYLGRGSLAPPRMSKKGCVAFTSTQTSYMEKNAGRDRVQVGVGFRATRFHESSSWHEHAAVTFSVAPESLETVEYCGFSASYKACTFSLSPARLRSIRPFKKHLCVGANTHEPTTQRFAPMAALTLICCLI